MEVVYKLAKSNKEIIDWVESHGGRPAVIDDLEVVRDKVGLRINWKGKGDEAMLSEEREVTSDISWEEFFSIMENQNLAFMYSESDDVSPTWTYKFVNKFETGVQ